MLILFVAIVLLIGERPAFAYVDPGMGSLLYQTVLTLILGFGLVFRRLRGSVVDFLRRVGGRGASSSHGDHQQP